MSRCVLIGETICMSVALVDIMYNYFPVMINYEHIDKSNAPLFATAFCTINLLANMDIMVKGLCS